jgi:tetratricopeptide (TPR) repeat protein
VQKKLKELTDTLAEFVDQQDYLTLVMSVDDAGMALIVKTLQGIDQQNASDLFVLIPDDAVAPDLYLTAIAARLEADRMVVNDMLAQEGKPPWPELPVACLDRRLPDSQRLRAMTEYVRGLMPKDGDHRVIWALLPMTIKDPLGYARIVGQLVPRAEIEPWMRGTRFIVRDDRTQPFIIPSLQKMQAPGVLTYAPDFSTAAVEAALTEEALDPEIPVPQRMNNLLQLAALDYSYGRFEDSIEKYGVLFTYFTQTGAKELQAMCLQGVGDVMRRIGKPVAAKEKYEQGLLLCADSQALVVTLNLCVAAGDTSFELKQLDEARGYYELADKIATKIVNPFVKADCLEKIGMVMELGGQIGPAAKIWTDATQLCRQMEYEFRLVSILERLRAMYKNARMTKPLHATEAELNALKARQAKAS